MKTATKPRKAPFARHVEFIPGGIHYFEVESSKSGVFYSPEVEIGGDFKVRCDCPDFTMRKAKLEPGIGDAANQCKHIHACIEWLLDKGHLEVEDLQIAALLHDLCPCSKCSMPDAEYPLCDEAGRLIDGRMCAVCLNELRASNEQWSPHAQELRSQISTVETRSTVVKADLLLWPDSESLLRELEDLHARLMDLWRAYNACEPRSSSCD